MCEGEGDGGEGASVGAIGGSMTPLPRRGSPETGVVRGSLSPLTTAAPTRAGAERLVSSRPITEFVRRRAALGPPPEPKLRSSPMGLFVPSDNGATSVKLRRGGSDMP